MSRHHGQAALATEGFRFARAGSNESTGNDEFDLKNFERLPARDVPLDALSPSLRLRQGGTSGAHVQLLVEAGGTKQLPPILVQEEGWRVIDGLHRLEAARLRGDHVIPARFLDCTDAEALILAMQANIAHGLPLSRADRLSGANRVLSEYPDWSDRALAAITGLSAKTIASLRTRSTGAAEAGGKRIGRDGRRRPVTAVEGRRRAAAYLNAHPNAPLRQVAREADVSLGTVHDVSARLRRGFSPERTGHRPPPVEPPTGPARRAAVPTPALPAPQGGAVRRPGRTDAPLTWSGVAKKLATDPSIRYTEGGRAFIRWMAWHAGAPHRWREVAGSIPPHWLSVIAPLADSISEEWSLFAEQLKRKQEDGP
ncbi:ParB/RepB/Spo0J family partition protein [Salinispora tropica]|uniref:ParB domain protein nuclease n=1 Tax=Salinispora tropica (strain ATCC BAA-916 / DSM 44818 / JCM 13857 / NBRC 105044 / CNB-440) TaxID=369723 RepID=A4X6Y8_SALTO|nr:ParB N-terminal domain-containing protein [Salinispora tropica]ABP54638.1 ParB domain protein nuclease [Salinispora tropica CNB-440]